MTNGPSIDAAKNLAAPHEGSPPTPANKPRAPFKTNLILTRKQEDELMTRAEDWLRALGESSGWDKSSTDEAIEQGVGAAAADPFQLSRFNKQHFIRRAYYASIAENEWGWRRYAYGHKSIFTKQNLSCPLARRISRAMAAKAIHYFFSTRPYFVCYPVGVSDEEKAESIQKVAELKLEASGGTAALRDAMNQAFDLGEAVLKVSHRRRVSLYRKNDVVLGDAAGKAVLGKDGEYITEKDGWVLAEVPVAQSPDAMPPLPGETAAPVLTEQAQVLKRDGVTRVPAGAQWLSGSFARTVTHYKGPEITLIDHRNFLANWDAPTLQDAECCVHLYEVSPADLASMFTTSDSGMQILPAVELLRALGDINPVASRSAGDGQTPQPASTKVKCREYWMKCDADADGITEDVCLVTAELGGEYVPLFYDYVQNVTETQERPFFAVVPVRRKGSWTGIGAVELFAAHQEAVDLFLNRWAFATSSAGHITIYDPAAFESTDGEDVDLTLNDGGTYKLLPGRRIEDAVKRIYLEDNIGDKWMQIMQSFMQMAMNESGVQHANDGGLAGMETTKLATGIRNVEQAGNENFGVFLASLEDGVQPVLQAFVNTLYGCIDAAEVARITEDGVSQMWSVEPRDVAGLKFDVTILMSRFRSEQLMESVRAVLPDCMAYYTLSPVAQVKLAPLFHQLLKAAQIQNPDRIIAPALDYPPEAYQAAAQFAMASPEVQQLAPLISLASKVVPMPAAGGQRAQPQQKAAA